MAKQTFGESMREDRMDLGLTQKQFAGLVGMAQDQVSGYETGNHKPRSEARAKIEAILGKQPD